ncbi:MAG: 2-hydroxychromene-2-carboxylate isomerase [Alphaproteobacteria bacterium]
MNKIIDYYYALASPWTYLGGPRLDRIAAEHGARVNFRPVDLGKVFPVSGGLPLPKRAPQRQAYRLVELARWRDHLGMALNLEPAFFPVNEARAARMVVAARRAGMDAGRLTNAILRAVWAEERNIADADTLAAIAGENGLDGDALLAAADTGAVADEYAADTAEAIERGVFGAPTYIYEGELFWGQDRLDFLERALAADGG